MTSVYSAYNAAYYHSSKLCLQPMAISYNGHMVNNNIMFYSLLHVTFRWIYIFAYFPVIALVHVLDDNSEHMRTR